MRTLTAVAEIESEVAQGSRVVLFHATWCPFCRSFKPEFEAAVAARGLEPLETLLGDDADPRWAAYRLRALPTVIAFEAGAPVRRLDAQLGVGIRLVDLERMLDASSGSVES